MSNNLQQLATAIQPLLAAYTAGAFSHPPAPAAPVARPAPVPVAATSSLKPAKSWLFKGNAKDIKAWLDSMRSHLLTQGFLPPFPGINTVVWASTYLASTAKDWWLARKTQSGDQDDAGFASFESFAEALAKHFADPFPEATADAALASLSLDQYKGQQSIRAFCADFLKISVDLPNRDAQDLIRDFLRKLACNKALQTHLITPYPSSLQNAIDRALQWDSIVNNNPTISPGSKAVASTSSPMELDSMEASTSGQSVCNYCKKPGHWIADCRKRKAKNEREAKLAATGKGKTKVEN